MFIDKQKVVSVTADMNTLKENQVKKNKPYSTIDLVYKSINIRKYK